MTVAERFIYLHMLLKRQEGRVSGFVRMGTLVMASGKDSDVSKLTYSNMVRVKLLKGNNAITIKQLRLPKSFTPCTPVHVRINSF